MRGFDSLVLWSDGSRSVFDIDISTNPTSGVIGFDAVLTSAR
jgi:hypothetical protein